MRMRAQTTHDFGHYFGEVSIACGLVLLSVATTLLFALWWL